MSPTADASVCTAKKLISARSSQDKPWGSKKSKKVFGWSALWSTISATSIWRKKLCSLSTTLLAQKCNLCLRYDLLPMCPGRTFEIWWTRRDSNPRPPRCERGALPAELLAQSYHLLTTLYINHLPGSSWDHWDHNQPFLASSDTTFRLNSVGKCVYLLFVFNEVWPTHLFIRSLDTL